MSRQPPPSEFQPPLRPLDALRPRPLFQGEVLGRALFVSACLHGALLAGGLAWFGAVLRRPGPVDRPPVVEVRSQAEVPPPAEERPPVQVDPVRPEEPELRPVPEEEEPEILPIDWMVRPPEWPSRDWIAAAARGRPEPPPEPEPVAETDPEPVPEPETDEPAAEAVTVDAPPASRVEASYDPDPRLSPPPEYPRLAVRRGWEGIVLLEASIDAEGRLVDLIVVRSSGHEVLDRAAIEAVRGWAPGAFRPAMEDGRPVPGVVPIQFRFEIQRRR